MMSSEGPRRRAVLKRARMPQLHLNIEVAPVSPMASMSYPTIAETPDLGEARRRLAFRKHDLQPGQHLGASRGFVHLVNRGGSGDACDWMLVANEAPFELIDQVVRYGGREAANALLKYCDDLVDWCLHHTFISVLREAREQSWSLQDLARMGEILEILVPRRTVIPWRWEDMVSTVWLPHMRREQLHDGELKLLVRTLLVSSLEFGPIFNEELLRTNLKLVERARKGTVSLSHLPAIGQLVKLFADNKAQFMGNDDFNWDTCALSLNLNNVISSGSSKQSMDLVHVLGGFIPRTAAPMALQQPTSDHQRWTYAYQWTGDVLYTTLQCHRLMSREYNLEFQHSVSRCFALQSSESECCQWPCDNCGGRLDLHSRGWSGIRRCSYLLWTGFAAALINIVPQSTEDEVARILDWLLNSCVVERHANAADAGMRGIYVIVQAAAGVICGAVPAFSMRAQHALQCLVQALQSLAMKYQRDTHMLQALFSSSCHLMRLVPQAMAPSDVNHRVLAIFGLEILRMLSLFEAKKVCRTCLLLDLDSLPSEFAADLTPAIESLQIYNEEAVESFNLCSIHQNSINNY